MAFELRSTSLRPVKVRFVPRPFWLGAGAVAALGAERHWQGDEGRVQCEQQHR